MKSAQRYMAAIRVQGVVKDHAIVGLIDYRLRVHRFGGETDLVADDRRTLRDLDVCPCGLHGIAVLQRDAGIGDGQGPQDLARHIGGRDAHCHYLDFFLFECQSIVPLNGFGLGGQVNLELPQCLGIGREVPAQRGSAKDAPGHESILRIFLDGFVGDLCGDLGRDHDHAVGIAHDEVARDDGDAPASDRAPMF